MTITATVLCIISAIPLLCGVFFTQLLNGSQLDQLMTGLLLQTDDYIPKKKLGRKIMNKYATLYWLIAVLLYLGYSFITNDWERSWIIWPIAGILYGIIEKIIGLCHNDIAAE